MLGYYYILDENGNPIPEPDVLTWARWFETADRVVTRDELPGGLLVSTVFLGLDYNILGTRPILFETMVFAGDSDDLDCARYSTRDEALAGHARVLARLEEIREKARRS